MYKNKSKKEKRSRRGMSARRRSDMEEVACERRREGRGRNAGKTRRGEVKRHGITGLKNKKEWASGEGE